MGFTGDVVVRQLDAKRWTVVEPLAYDERAESFEVPAGFVTDSASVPTPFTWLVPRYGLYTKAAILHDYLCRTGEVSRADADGLFRRSMRELGVSVPHRYLMWTAVRLASLLRGSSPADWLAIALSTAAALVLVVGPAIIVQVFLWAFWLVEAPFWLVGKVLGRGQPLPVSPAQTT